MEKFTLTGHEVRLLGECLTEGRSGDAGVLAHALDRALHALTAQQGVVKAERERVLSEFVGLNKTCDAVIAKVRRESEK